MYFAVGRINLCELKSDFVRFSPIADKRSYSWNVRFVPKADIIEMRLGPTSASRQVVWPHAAGIATLCELRHIEGPSTVPYCRRWISSALEARSPG